MLAFVIDDGETEMGVEFDIDSLQDFRKALESRLSQAQKILTAVDTQLSCSRPPIGTFADANIYAGASQTKNAAYLDRVTKLRDSLKVALAGTDQIITNYKTVEALNHANATEIANRMDKVGSTLNPKKNGAA
jgi:hypothetical protein